MDTICFILMQMAFRQMCSSITIGNMRSIYVANNSKKNVLSSWVLISFSLFLCLFHLLGFTPSFPIVSAFPGEGAKCTSQMCVCVLSIRFNCLNIKNVFHFAFPHHKHTRNIEAAVAKAHSTLSSMKRSDIQTSGKPKIE